MRKKDMENQMVKLELSMKEKQDGYALTEKNNIKVKIKIIYFLYIFKLKEENKALKNEI